jgi:putative salt-induced outer membrane protein YdiY
MTFATGTFYEHEIWDYAAVDSSKLPSNTNDIWKDNIKCNNYIKWDGNVSPICRLAFAIFYQAKWNDFFNPRIATVFSLDIDASKHFGLSLKYSGTYDAKPVVPITKFYYMLSNNLVYHF